MNLRGMKLIALALLFLTMACSGEVVPPTAEPAATATPRPTPTPIPRYRKIVVVATPDPHVTPIRRIATPTATPNTYVADTIATVEAIRKNRKLTPTPTPYNRSSPTPVRVFNTPFPTPQPSPISSRPTKSQILSAQWGCGHFRNVLGDYIDQVLTRGGFRAKLREVAADLSDVPDAGPAARRLLAAATNGNYSAIEQATSSLVRICVRYYDYDIE